jgi:hypothetical protein
MTDVIAELRARRRRQPFEPFVIVLKDGRRLPVNRRLQYAFTTEDRALVIDERDLVDFFKPSDIVAFESLHPVG